ncbi:uncharacterized protein PHACADRAFT_248485, partial [Phanerochaete carnosa HHB-10118-sp]
VGHVCDSTGVFSWDVLPPRISYRRSYIGDRRDVLEAVKLLPSLRNLTIGSYNSFGPEFPSVNDILQALAPLQALETLRLVCSNRESNPQEIPTQVSLPRLRSLVLTGALRWCIALLAHLTIPTTTSVRVIEVSFNHSAAEDLLPVLPKIIGTENDNYPPILSIAMHGKIDVFPNMIVSGWKHLESVLDHCPLPDFSLALSRRDVAFDRMLEHLPLGNARSLFVHDSAINSASAWSARFRRHFNNVEELRIGGRCDLCVVRKMLRGEDTLPRLRTLQLDDVERLHCPRPVLTRGCKHADCFHFLEHILQKRSASGRRILRLVLKTKTPLAPLHLAAFSAVVGEVVQRQVPVADGAVLVLPPSDDDLGEGNELYSSDSTGLDSGEE